MSHRQTKCSGLGKAAQAVGRWRCSHACDGMPPVRADIPPVVGGVPADAGRRDSMCPACGRKLRACRFPMICSRCGQEYHQRCSGLPEDARARWAESGLWVCEPCATPPPVQPAGRPVGEPVSERSRDFARQNSLRVVQWNVDGIRTALPELAQMLRDRSIDVCLVQESKLVSGDHTPRIPGYAALRRDRPIGPGGARVRGGGLLIYIKDCLPFYEVPAFREGTVVGKLEALAVELRIGKRGERFTLVNVYFPPVRTGDRATRREGFDPNVLVASRRHLIGGDWNCHSPLWDPHQPEDAEGETLERWMADNQMGCLNDGSATRVNRGTGGLSSPDVTLVHNSWLGRVEWCPLGVQGSDHFPLLFEVNLSVDRLVEEGFRLRWNW